MKEIQAIVRQLLQARTRSVLVTLTTVDGSSYRRPGARMLITEGRPRVGSISGGCLEEDLAERSKRVAATRLPELVVYDTSDENDLVWGVGLGCQGTVRILLEPLEPQPPWAAAVEENLRAGRPTLLEVTWESFGGRLGTSLATRNGEADPPPGVFLDHILPPTSLAIFGAGDDAQPLARIARELGWRVTVADPRAALLTLDRFPDVFARVLGPAEELAARASLPPGSLAVVMTHHYRHDLPLLQQLLPLPLAYLGLLGPKRRADKILSDLREAGLVLSAEMRGRLRAPVGLDLGANTPEEVALSIMSEMKAVLAGRDGRPLRDRDQPIHA